MFQPRDNGWGMDVYLFPFPSHPPQRKLFANTFRHDAREMSRFFKVMETQAIATKPVSEFNRHNPVCSMRFIDLRGVEALPPEPATGTEDGGTIHQGRVCQA
ncbi:hypothetical protein BC938DRAFT_477902 [Jimgerdemannia flammicorona]|uniref:Uncharacterized protein n=1 Tax=Jimgerdemannia flammicorona TaxID=994334 RepID=A0A433P794_9FUNG|nr:hypothetical protein BC938DRAFT_477902 [Jimgerdemannia flammicorona]